MDCAGSVQFWMSWFFGELQFGKGSEYDPGTIIVGATQPGSFVITALSLEVSSGTTSFDPIAREYIYCRSGSICEILIFSNFATRTNSRFQESLEDYY